MAAHSGLSYFLELLGVPDEALLVHYRFNDSGAFVANDAPLYPQYSGVLSADNGFWSNSGSGSFGGQKLSINNPSGLATDVWSHIAVVERQNPTGGVVFSNLATGAPPSGFSWGYNDANRLFFQAEGQYGPICLTSNLILGRKNIVGVISNGESISFCTYNFTDQEVMWDEKATNSTLFTARGAGVIGGIVNPPAFAYANSLSGYIDDYLIFNEAVTPSTFRYICSGLVSVVETTAGTVTSIEENLVTGYGYVITGVTGVLGYTNSITGSGLNPFGTGDYELFWGSVPVTGYLASGSGVVPLTGLHTTYLTGDSTSTLKISGELIETFTMNEVSLLFPTDETDFVELHAMQSGTVVNKQAGFDSVQAKFQLDSQLTDSSLIFFVNGASQLGSGFAVTGNGFVSGVQLSGDYRIDGFYIDSTGIYDLDDVGIYDIISGERSVFVDTSIANANTIGWFPSGNIIFLNGLLLSSGLDYTVGGGGFTWATDKYDGASGTLSSYGNAGYSRVTGIAASPLLDFSRNRARLFVNGLRLNPKEDYIENCDIDLIKISGVFASVGDTIYDKAADYFETYVG